MQDSKRTTVDVDSRAQYISQIQDINWNGATIYASSNILFFIEYIKPYDRVSTTNMYVRDSRSKTLDIMPGKES